MLSRIKNRINRVIIKYIDYATSQLRKGERDRIQMCNVQGHVILLDIESQIEQFRADTYGSKEPETLEWIQRYFRNGDVFYDVGANIGLYSLFSAKHLKGACKVYAFEPESLNYSKLNRNVYLNDLSGVVIPCCLAVTNKLSFDLFHLHPNAFNPDVLGEGLFAGSALHSFGSPVDWAGRSFVSVHQQGMMGLSLDDLWQKFGLEFPNHIKVDVDGIEEDIVQGATETIRDSRLKSLLIEARETSPISEIFIQAGFKRFPEFSVHSREQAKGSLYEGTVNMVFARE